MLFVFPSQVSTHGYSQNQILVWKYPSLTQVAKLTGHSYRVLYLVSIYWATCHGASPEQWPPTTRPWFGSHLVQVVVKKNKKMELRTHLNRSVAQKRSGVTALEDDIKKINVLYINEFTGDVCAGHVP